MAKDNKDHWVIPHAESVSVMTKKEVYPMNIILSGHKHIEEMEIPNDEYIRVKMRGEWHKLYLGVNVQLFVP